MSDRLDTTRRPPDSLLEARGIKVAVMFLDGVVVMMPRFGGYYDPPHETLKYNEALRFVSRRLKKLGYSVDG